MIAATVPAAADEPAPLQFAVRATEGARAGHATLDWSPHPQAVAYRLHDQRRRVIYRGRFSKAFVSGLTDGRQRFWVSALDAHGNVIARSSQPTVVVVRHWPMPLAWGLFGVGAIVVSTLAVVLVGGALGAQGSSEAIGESDAIGGDGPTTEPAASGSTDRPRRSRGAAR